MNFLKVSVIILFIILTVLSIKIHPEMHQPMIIEDADFKLTRISDTVVTTNIPLTPVKSEEQRVTVVTPSSTQNVTVTQPAAQQKTIEIKTVEPVQTKTVQTKTAETKPVQITQVPQAKKETPVQTSSPEPSQMELLQRLLNTDIEDTQALQENAQKLAQTMQPKPAQPPKQVQQPTQSAVNKNPYMTEQEEIIAWNKWRSNIQNQIMKDSDIDYAPLGTTFMFTFIVDKFGNVSNIKVECSNPNFMDVARKNVKPAIANLQRKPILNFPRGTQRTSTIVTGIFLIGTQERFSTPNDFSDYERVTH